MSKKLNRRDFVRATTAAGVAAAAAPKTLFAQTSPQSPTMMTPKSVKPVVISAANGNKYKNGGNQTCVAKAFEMIAGGSDVLDAVIAGVNLVELPPGESIPEHDETERDQEELFFVLDGSPAIVIDGAEHPAPAGTFARLDPNHRRTVRNHGDGPATVLIVSAPMTSGFHPMEWA